MNNPAAQPFLNISPTKQTPLRSVRRTSRRRNSRRRNSRRRNSRRRNSRGRNSRRRNTRRRNTRRRNTRRRSSRRNSRRRNTRRRNTRRRSSRRNKNQLGGDEVNIVVKFGPYKKALSIKLDRVTREISFTLPLTNRDADIKVPFSTVDDWFDETQVSEGAVLSREDRQTVWVKIKTTPELIKMLGGLSKEMNQYVAHLPFNDMVTKKTQFNFWCEDADYRDNVFTEEFRKMAEEMDDRGAGVWRAPPDKDCDKRKRKRCIDDCTWDTTLDKCRNILL